MSYNGNVDNDIVTIMETLRRIQETSGKRWMLAGELHKVEAYLRSTMAGETPSDCWSVGGVFVMWQVGTPWWAAGPLLQEELMVAVAPRPDLGMVITFLESLARMKGASGVALGVGLSSRERALARIYRQRGYVQEDSLLYKEL